MSELIPQYEFEREAPKAYIMYHGRKVYVTVESTFQGSNFIWANLKAEEGYPFNSNDIQAQGESFGSWACNGYRERLSFVYIENAIIENFIEMPINLVVKEVESVL